MYKIKIAIVDDHMLFMEGLSALLEKQPDFEVAGKFESGPSLFDALDTNFSPDIILLDLTMPDMSGFEVLKKLKKRKNSPAVIAISMHEDGNYISRCVRLGAKGYLLKNTAEKELIEAIYKVQSGLKYFNDDISALLIDHMSLEGSNPQRLSNKESEVLHMIADGLTSKEIASKLYISVRTVETHRMNILKKLEVKNTAELIKKATKLHLL
jgi:DNA-binding NarL/FixJ family response regulator